MFRRAPLPCLVTLSALMLYGQAQGAEPRDRATLFIRLPPTMLVDVQQQGFEREQEIEDLVLGTTVTGHSVTKGKCSVESGDAEHPTSGLRLIVAGTSITESTGRNGPAIIRSTTTTQFEATVPLTFTAERGFCAGEPEIKADTRVRTDEVKTTYRGALGRALKSVAERKVAQSLPEATRLARDSAVARIEKQIATELNERLERLNQTYADLRRVVGLLPPELVASSLMATEQEHVLISFACAKEHAADVPRRFADLDCHGEVWVHRGAAGDDFADHVARSTRPMLAASMQPLAVGTARTAEAPSVERHGSWYVIRFPSPAEQMVD